MRPSFNSYSAFDTSLSPSMSNQSPFLFKFQSQIESRAILYEPGKTVLRYDRSLASVPLTPSSRKIIYGPSTHSENSNGSDGSQETGDSGRYSGETSHEEMSNPSSSRGSRPESFGLEEAELKGSFQVEDEEMPSPSILSHSAPDSTQPCCTLEGHVGAQRLSMVDS